MICFNRLEKSHPRARTGGTRLNFLSIDAQQTPRSAGFSPMRDAVQIHSFTYSTASVPCGNPAPAGLSKFHAFYPPASLNASKARFISARSGSSNAQLDPTRADWHYGHDNLPRDKIVVCQPTIAHSDLRKVSHAWYTILGIPDSVGQKALAPTKALFGCHTNPVMPETKRRGSKDILGNRFRVLHTQHIFTGSDRGHDGSLFQRRITARSAQAH